MTMAISRNFYPVVHSRGLLELQNQDTYQSPTHFTAAGLLYRAVRRLSSRRPLRAGCLEQLRRRRSWQIQIITKRVECTCVSTNLEMCVRSTLQLPSSLA